MKYYIRHKLEWIKSQYLSWRQMTRWCDETHGGGFIVRILEGTVESGKVRDGGPAKEVLHQTQIMNNIEVSLSTYRNLKWTVVNREMGARDDCNSRSE